MNYGAEKKLWLTEVETERLYADQRIEIYRKAYRAWDGKIMGPYYSLKLGDYVIIVATDTAGNYICVRQFRQGFKGVTTEFPAGGIVSKAVNGSYTPETLLENAKRELREETGYISDKWTQLYTVPANATLADNYAYIFLAEDCEKLSEQCLDETEYLEVEIYSPDQLDSLIRGGGFQHAVHVLALYLAKEKKARK